MKSTKSKSTNYLLANRNGKEIYFTVPDKNAKDQKYYIEHNNNGRKKYYGNGSVKMHAVEFFNDSTSDAPKTSGIESRLTELFKQVIEK